METKVCQDCKQNLPLTSFYIQKHKKFNRIEGEYIKEYVSAYCKNCDQIRAHIAKSKPEYQKRKSNKHKKRLQEDLSYREKVNKQKRDNSRKNYISLMLSRAKQRALKYNYEFTLVKEDIIIPKLCPLLQVPFKLGKKGNYQYTPTIDRIDSTKGYTKDNIQILTMKANTMKSNASKKELITFSKNILNYYQEDIVQPT